LIMQDLAINLAGEVAHQLMRAQNAAYAQQAAAGSGPLSLMDNLELRHWLRQFCMAVHAAAADSLRAACNEHARGRGAKASIQPFQVCCDHTPVRESAHQQRRALLVAPEAGCGDNTSQFLDR
jgi:hypothetical protein